jgi:DNA-binding HxlR family transcriptional regulator
MAMILEGPLADRDAWRATECSVDLAMGIVGTRTAMLILREAYYGTTRFDDFAERVGMSDAVAAARLKELVSAGVLERRPYREPGSRTRAEYVLTDSGRGLFAAVLGLAQWADRHQQPDGAPLELVDANGRPVRVAVIDVDGSEVSLDEVHVRVPERRLAAQRRA